MVYGVKKTTNTNEFTGYKEQKHKHHSKRRVGKGRRGRQNRQDTFEGLRVQENLQVTESGEKRVFMKRY